MRETQSVTIKRRITVDAEIADEIVWLNDQGVKTEASCAGHGQYPAHALILPSSAEHARELGYSPEDDEQSGLFKIELQGRDGSFDVVLNDGRTAHCRPVATQPYRGASFSAGLVEGAEPDTVYLQLEKGSQGPFTVLLRPDEMQAIAWVCAGTLWSQGVADCTVENEQLKESVHIAYEAAKGATREAVASYIEYLASLTKEQGEWSVGLESGLRHVAETIRNGEYSI